MYELALYESKGDGVEELVQTYRTGLEEFTGIMYQQAVNHAMKMPDPCSCYIIDHKGARLPITPASQPLNNQED